MRSMTGFGRAAAEGENLRISVHLKGVNHRFLDIVVRGGEGIREFEPAIRQRLAKELHRGRVEVHVDLAMIGDAARPKVDEEAVQALRGLGERLAAAGVVTSADFSFAELLRMPGVFGVSGHQELEWSPGDRRALDDALDAALEQMVGARALEGEKLTAALVQRLDGLGEVLGQLREHQAGLTDELLTNLRCRLGELLGDAAVDEARLAQEAAVLVDRADIAEELDRLGSHLEHFREVLAQGGSLGKRLDFLAQEIFRELNTVGSKCRKSSVTRVMVDGKVLCEQLREQVQNVE